MNETPLEIAKNSSETVENFICVPTSIAYKVTTKSQLEHFNDLFGLRLMHEEVYCYPALYVVMLGSFICMRVDAEDNYKNLGYHIVQIK